MKKLLFIVFIILVSNKIIAQVFQKPVPTIKQSTIIKTSPAIPPPPQEPSTNKSTGSVNQNMPVYALTSARLVIKTGNDNKEFPSAVGVTLMAKSAPSNWRTYIQTNLGNEMRINSDTEFGLDVAGAPIPLEIFQQSGLSLSISYTPNFFADAWKIESVSLKLEFKDQNGNLHPSLGNKTIVFSNAYGILNNDFRYMKCYSDASFLPVTAAIQRTY